MLKPTRILVPTDFSKYSDIALRQAFDIAIDYKSTVYILHVAQGRIHYALSDDYTGMALTIKNIETIEKDLLKKAKEQLNGQVTRLLRGRNIKVIQNVVTGIPYEEILKEEKKKKINLIIIASLGKSGIARFLLGSVARNVLKGAKCHVLLTK